jgi:hypothetical protein
MGSMLIWILLSVGLLLAMTCAWLAVSMGRAERRARRSLYRTLGLAEATVDFLMERNRDVLAELSYVRENEATVAETIQFAPPRQAAAGDRPKLRLVRGASEGSRLPGEQSPSAQERPTQH